jgi:dihydrofolate reductase
VSRRVVLWTSISIDGYFEGPNRELDWHRVDDELHGHFNEALAQASLFVEGRRTYELMESYWPTADEDPAAEQTVREFAGIWRAMPKLVYSRTLESVGPNAELRREIDPDEIDALKSEPGGDMVLGGADLGAAFLRLGLVDELRLYVHPVVIGRGNRLFADDAQAALTLEETREFGNGVVMLRYSY